MNFGSGGGAVDIAVLAVDVVVVVVVDFEESPPSPQR